MRHVSRTHRVDLDWLLDRINLCPGVQTKCVDTNQEIADILTQGSFSRERRSQLTQLFNLVTPHVRTTSHFRTTKTTRCQIGMLKLSQKVPACAQLVCVRYKWRRTTRQTMLLAWNTHPRRKRLGATISDHKASRQALLRAWKSQPLNTLQDGSSMRQQSKLQVQLTKDEFTTSDPALICQPTKWSRWSSERSSTESKLGNSERCDISWQRSQWNKQFGIFMNECIWAVLHLSKDEKELRRILKNHSVRQIMANIETLQAQPNKLTFRDSQVFGTHLVLDCRDNNRKHISLISLLSEPVVKITHTTVYVFTDSVLCLGGRCQGYPWLNESMGVRHRVLCAK